MGSLKAVLKEKCPRCSEGDLYQYKKWFTFSKKSYQMNKNCPCCGLKYEKEVGFFHGAMYISYALNTALFTISVLIYRIFFKSMFDWLQFGLAFLVITILCTAFIFRLSRAIWISIFTKSNTDILNEKKTIPVN